ncbi:MAG TPA: MFS transporter [Thermomicrobiales bacterium]|nr:MFS transporter [Thermomicrobiales bacterium]HRA48207.1 MFS transporter [Thermomicrobiales bacterium]
MTDDRSIRANRRSYAGLIGSSFISNGGNAFSELAIPLFVLETTGSAAQTGITAVAAFAPPFITSIFGGALVDRVGRRKMLLLSESLNIFGTATIPILHILGWLNFPLLLAIVALGAMLDSPGRTARSAMIPNFATRAGLSPERAQSVNQSGFLLARTIGPALAGVAIGLWGATTAIWIDAGSFLVSLLLVALFVDTPEAIVKVRPTTYREDLLEGFHFVWREPFLRAMVIFIAYLTMFYVPLFSVVYPVYFTEITKSTKAFGVFVGLESLGTFVGGLGYGYWGHRVSRWKVLILSQFAGLPFFWLLIFSPSVPILFIAALFNGFLTGPLNPVAQVAIQVRTPEHMRSRVHSLINAGTLLVIPIGALTIGAMIEWIGVLWTYGFIALFYSLGPIAVAMFPVFHLIDSSLPEATTA